VVALGLGASLMPSSHAQDDIVLGMSAAFSGASGQLGIELYQGAQAYFADVNAQGGVAGRRIRILARDDGYDPTRAIFNTIELIETERVPLLFGYVGTPTVTRVLPLLKRYEERGPYLLFPFTGAQPQRQPPYGEFVFNLRASYLQETAGLVDHLVAVGRRRIAIFYQADAYGRSGWDGVRAALARHDLKLAGEATYRRGTTYDASMAAQVRALQASQPDAIIAVGAYAACAAFVREVVDQGWDVPVANVSFVGSESLLGLLDAERQRTGRDYTSRLINSQVVPSYEDQSLASVREYRALLDRHRPAPPNGIAVQTDAPPFTFVGFEGFLNAKLLVEILRRSEGATDRTSIRRAFEGIDALDLGIDAPLDFGPGRRQGLDAVYYTRASGNRFVPLTDWQAWAR
jgi:ABC-type branched-subunit amino acid transport system substrate-binding protein